MSTPSSIEQAWQLIDEGAYAEANALGEALVRAGDPEGFQVQAAVLEADEAWEQAAQLLRKGVGAHPESWQLWLSLGNTHGNLGAWSKATRAYERARQCAEADVPIVDLYRARALALQLDYDGALNLLQQLTDTSVRTEAFAFKLNLLHQLERHDLVLELGEEELEDLEIPQHEEDARSLAAVCAWMAIAAWNEEREEEEVAHYLRQAVAYDRTNPDCLWLMREMAPDYSENPHYYKLLVRGRWQWEDGGHAGEEPMEFLTSYEIVADDEEEALEYVRAFEGEAVLKDQLDIMEVEEEACEEDEVKGIYLVGGMAFLEA